MQDREGHEDNATPAFAVVKASTSEATDTENLLPRNAGGVHPFSGTPVRPFLPRGQLLCCVRERCG